MATADASKFVLCPYCGHIQLKADRCEECSGIFEPLSRMATQIAMGPWYIRDKNMPYRPGCSYETLKRQVELGRIKATTVLRGPSTKQFWSLARNTPGVAHLLGICHECGGKVAPEETECPTCGAEFESVTDRNKMGLMYATDAEANTAQKKLEHLIAVQLGTAPAANEEEAAVVAGKSDKTGDGQRLPGLDVLEEVIGTGVVAMAELQQQETDRQARGPQESPILRFEAEDKVETATSLEEARIPGAALDFTPSNRPAPAAPAAAPAPPPPPAEFAGYPPARAVEAAAPAYAPQQAPAPAYAPAAPPPPAYAPAPAYAPPARQRGSNSAVLFLVLLNLITLLAVAGGAAFFYLNKTQNAANSATDAPPVDPAPSRNAAQAPAQVVPVDPQGTSMFSNPTPPARNGSTTAPPAVNPAPAPRQAAPVEVKAPPAPPENSLAGIMERAKQLASQKKYDQALELLRKLERETPLASRPANLENEIRRIEADRNREQAIRFFE